MLKTVRVDQLRLGMHLHSLGGAWLGHPLNRPGKLTPAEYQRVKHRPRRGHQLPLQGGVASPAALDMCRHHHERADGQGYSEGLSGDALFQPARRRAACDVYDDITSNRPYEEGRLPADSLAKMAEWTRAGKFDAAVFKRVVPPTTGAPPRRSNWETV
jgi:HD-GYP domain-containing protein (c-di-GMP phosphodiesterase class II)